MRFFIAITILVILCSACQTLRGRLHTIDVSDDVSKSEAMIIGECYWEKHLEGGEITDIRDGGDYWIVLGKLGGYLAKPMSIDVDKLSGKVISKVGPSYDSPFDIYP